MLRRQCGRWGMTRIMVRGGEWHQECWDVNIGELSWAQECQKTRNNCLNKKIFVWNTSDTLQRQDHVETSSSQMLFIFYILKSEMNFSFCLARHAAATVCCFLDFNSSLSTDSLCLSILTNAVMISGIVINTVNQIPPLRVALQQIMKSLHSSNCRHWLTGGHEYCLTTKWFTKLNTMEVKTWIIIGPAASTQLHLTSF